MFASKRNEARWIRCVIQDQERVRDSVNGLPLSVQNNFQ
jgi:hypothetical protein